MSAKPWPRRAYADGPFGQIHYQAEGDGPALVLLHQAPMSSDQFARAYGPLSQAGHRVIGIDMPGFGMSDPCSHVPTIADYAAVVPAVLDAEAISKAAVLGHHTGALVAAHAAVHYPERVTTVILNGPLLVTEALRENFRQGLHRWELGYKALPHAAHMVELFDIRDRLAHGEIEPARLSDYVVHSLIGRGEFWHGHHAAYMYDLEPTLMAIGQKGLILTNTGDNIHAHAHQAVALRPDFVLASLDGGGVDIVDTHTQAWVSVVSDFLKSADWG